MKIIEMIIKLSFFIFAFLVFLCEKNYSRTLLIETEDSGEAQDYYEDQEMVG